MIQRILQYKNSLTFAKDLDNAIVIVHYYTSGRYLNFLTTKIQKLDLANQRLSIKYYLYLKLFKNIMK